VTDYLSPQDEEIIKRLRELNSAGAVYPADLFMKRRSSFLKAVSGLILAVPALGFLSSRLRFLAKMSAKARTFLVVGSLAAVVGLGAYILQDPIKNWLVPVISTPTVTPQPTLTDIPTSTFTPLPSATRIPSATFIPSSTPTDTPTATPVPTNTKVYVPPTGGSCGASLNANFEAQVISLINQQRANNGLAGLATSGALSNASRNHSLDMACNNFMNHIGSNGSDFGSRLSQAGFSFSTAAENIAAGLGSPADVVAAWMGSDGHKTNILNASFTHIGIGYANSSSSTYTHYWTADFGRP